MFIIKYLVYHHTTYDIEIMLACGEGACWSRCGIRGLERECSGNCDARQEVKYPGQRCGYVSRRTWIVLTAWTMAWLDGTVVSCPDGVELCRVSSDATVVDCSDRVDV